MPTECKDLVTVSKIKKKNKKNAHLGSAEATNGTPEHHRTYKYTF